ncbi:MAG: hypothetical protein M1817_006772 [Caeruleum heppii]|nr:MAG: hypothetical protein M1817_006772 [Caeruleum heppii]
MDAQEDAVPDEPMVPTAADPDEYEEALRSQRAQDLLRSISLWQPRDGRTPEPTLDQIPLRLKSPIIEYFNDRRNNRPLRSPQWAFFRCFMTYLPECMDDVSWIGDLLYDHIRTRHNLPGNTPLHFINTSRTLELQRDLVAMQQVIAILADQMTRLARIVPGYLSQVGDDAIALHAKVYSRAADARDSTVDEEVDHNVGAVLSMATNSSSARKIRTNSMNSGAMCLSPRGALPMVTQTLPGIGGFHGAREYLDTHPVSSPESSVSGDESESGSDDEADEYFDDDEGPGSHAIREDASYGHSRLQTNIAEIYRDHTRDRPLLRDGPHEEEGEGEEDDDEDVGMADVEVVLVPPSSTSPTGGERSSLSNRHASVSEDGEESQVSDPDSGQGAPADEEISDNFGELDESELDNGDSADGSEDDSKALDSDCSDKVEDDSDREISVVTRAHRKRMTSLGRLTHHGLHVRGRLGSFDLDSEPWVSTTISNQTMLRTNDLRAHVQEILGCGWFRWAKMREGFRWMTAEGYAEEAWRVDESRDGGFLRIRNQARPEW